MDRSGGCGHICSTDPVLPQSVECREVQSVKKSMKWLLRTVLALSLSLVMLFPVSVSAAEGTEGSEMQVMQPEQLVIQLGADWAGVEFELKTDAGMYPGTIPVGEDGMLRLEIGGSSSYTLTCLNSATPVPDPDETQAPATNGESNEKTEPDTQTEQEPETSSADETAQTVNTEIEASQEKADEQENTVAGIPILHLVLFGGGLVLAVGSLIIMQVMKRRNAVDAEYEEDEDE